MRPNCSYLINVVFDSRPVLWSARLLLVSAAFVLAVGGAYIVASTFVRMRNGEWLKRAGPFEVAEPAAMTLEDQVYFWQTTARTFEDDLERLRGRINETVEIIDEDSSDDDYDRL
ncbi:MAG TPA: hypothetical protein VN635_13220 [Conexibacter sp.]|nr:hypothetical protein [Conexibacter sp.]